MNGYNHYIRTNEAGMIIHGFSSAFEQPLETDYLFAEEAPRHFHESFTEPLTNERGQYRFKVVGAVFEKRSQTELDAEWLQQPSATMTAEERIAELEAENLSNMLALVELHGLILMLGGESE